MKNSAIVFLFQPVDLQPAALHAFAQPLNADFFDKRLPIQAPSFPKVNFNRATFCRDCALNLELIFIAVPVVESVVILLL